MQQRVVSLGGNCMVTMEMRRFFGIQEANLFDWWITPGEALVRLIENDFDGLFSKKNLKMVGDRRSVANLRYGILHHHDFPRDAEGRVIGIGEPDLRNNREKFVHLKKRWDDLGNNPGPVLFIRYGWDMGEALLAGIGPKPNGTQAANLIAVLEEKFPKLDFQILFIDVFENPLRQQKVLCRHTRIFTQPGEYLNAADLEWKDNTTVFSRLFTTVRVPGRK
jgi:hypothetical protein